MHATHVLDKHLRAHCQGTHERRMDAVISMVNALLRGRVLTMTGLGRSLRDEVAPKHQIKKAGRLIGNIHLHSERKEFYRALISLTLGNMKRPVILVDWSDVSDDRAFQKLRASMAVEGRAELKGSVTNANQYHENLSPTPFLSYRLCPYEMRREAI